MLTYLAGAIENAPDGGKEWRANITPFLTERLQHRVFNPCIEENHLLTEAEFKELRSAKGADLSRFRQLMHRIIRTDLKMLTTEVDYVICYWDRYVIRGGGTHGELTMAFYHNIPVYLVSEFQPTEISGWILGCCSELFFDFSSLHEYLLHKYKKTAKAV